MLQRLGLGLQSYPLVLEWDASLLIPVLWDSWLKYFASHVSAFSPLVPVPRVHAVDVVEVEVAAHSVASEELTPCQTGIVGLATDRVAELPLESLAGTQHVLQLLIEGFALL